MDRSVSTVLSADESAAEPLAARLESLLLARVRRAGLSTLGVLASELAQRYQAGSGSAARAVISLSNSM
jgi:hypothetical protein